MLRIFYFRSEISNASGLAPRILNDISGVSFSDCWRNRVSARFGGLRFNFIDLLHLLANKRASGRPKDQIDVTELTRVKRSRKK